MSIKTGGNTIPFGYSGFFMSCKSESWRGKNFIFTWNNYQDFVGEHGETALEYLADLVLDGTVRYFRASEEIGDNKTPHLQGYIGTENQVRKSFISKALLRKCHTQGMMGKLSQNATYCSKQAALWGIGNVPGEAGKQKTEMYTDIKKGKIKTPRDAFEKYEGSYLSRCKSIDSMMRLYNKPQPWEWKDKKVFVIWGDTGLNKDKQIGLECKRLFEEENLRTYKKSISTGQWWDQYEGEEVIWFEEFTGSSIKRTEFLQLLDGRPQLVQTKGGTATFWPDYIFISSSKNPLSWFNLGSLDPERQSNAEEEMMRRITTIIHKTGRGDDDFVVEKSFTE